MLGVFGVPVSVVETRRVFGFHVSTITRMAPRASEHAGTTPSGMSNDRWSLS